MDRVLLGDGTYYVIEAEDGLVACGGWSRRGKLYTGSGDAADDDRIIDPATEGARIRAMFTRPDRKRQGLGTRILEEAEADAKAGGVRVPDPGRDAGGRPALRRLRVHRDRRATVTMPDGTTLDCAVMTKPID